MEHFVWDTLYVVAAQSNEHVNLNTDLPSCEHIISDDSNNEMMSINYYNYFEFRGSLNINILLYDKVKQ